MSADERAAAVAEALAEHMLTSGFDEVDVYWKYACVCSWTGQSDDEHRAHVVAVVLAALDAAQPDCGHPNHGSEDHSCAPFHATQPDRGDVGGEGLSEDERDELLAKITWRLHHYGPIDAEPFRYSRHESPAHAALSAVEEFLAARARPASADTGQGEAERALDEVVFEALDVAHDQHAYHVHAAECCWPFSGALLAIRAALTTDGQP